MMAQMMMAQMGGWGDGWGGGGGKGWGKGGGWGKDAFQEQGIPGLAEAWKEAFEPIKSDEPQINEVTKQLTKKVWQVVDKYQKDEKAKQKLTQTAAKAYVEEYVEHIMSVVFNVLYEKAWFGKVNFTQPLLVIVLYTFQDGKIFTRTLKPQVVNYVEAGFFKWSEEARVDRAMKEAVDNLGVKGEWQKKCLQALTKSYEDAHFQAPYGTTHSDCGELAVLQDFVKGWMTLFIDRAWDVMEDGLSSNSRDVQVATVSSLFQSLLDPNVACMPSEIATQVTAVLGGLPAAPWSFIDECAMSVFAENDAKAQQEAERKAMNALKKQKLMK